MPKTVASKRQGDGGRLATGTAASPVTPFQRQVYQAVARIPKGRVMTYQGLARAIGCGSCQAVGQALKRNPFAPTVPCHRVINSDLTLGGFAGQRQGEEIDRKLALLAGEGVLFANGRLQDPCLVLEALPGKRLAGRCR